MTEPHRQPGKGPGEAATPGAPPAGRSSAVWGAVAAGMILLVILLVFILQNLQTAKVSFFTVHWRAPLAVDLLFATVLGALVVFAAGSVRILQLRREARRHAAGADRPAGEDRPGGGDRPGKRD